jgi:hypothetical protein
MIYAGKYNVDEVHPSNKFSAEYYAHAHDSIHTHVRTFFQLMLHLFRRVAVVRFHSIRLPCIPPRTTSYEALACHWCY